MVVRSPMRHMHPKPPKTDRSNRVPTTRNSVPSASLGGFELQVAEEQPHSQEAEEAKFGGSDGVKDEEGQADERPVGSQSLMGEREKRFTSFAQHQV